MGTHYAVFSLTEKEISNSVNTGIELFSKRMVAEGVITQEQHDQMSDYVVIVAQKGFFGKLKDKLFGLKDKSENILTYLVMKVSKSDSTE